MEANSMKSVMVIVRPPHNHRVVIAKKNSLISFTVLLIDGQFETSFKMSLFEVDLERLVSHCITPQSEHYQTEY